MKLSRLLLSALMIQGLSTNVLAQNRNDSDAIFNEGKTAKGTQIVLGLTEVVAAEMLANGTAESAEIILIKKQLSDAQSELDEAKKLFTSEAERQRLLKRARNNASSRFQRFHSKQRFEAVKVLHKLEDTAIVTAAEKAQKIQAAESKVSDLRYSLLRQGQKEGRVSKSLKILRVGGAVLLLSDVAARVYVWNAMDANPTFSPVATYLQYQITE